ncbi:MAG: tRNA (N6-threonylcarbamoyladenosine(37)-N6)-methyltransferase TrmO [Ruminococcus sp.]|nr:tRNA (N6-threonylcarbamoyladenosine(37)-N6)-methyltransferase TrmO [Ruminococcus sp.]
MNEYKYKIIAHIENDFKTKFGVPRQSGLCNDLTSKIIFEPEYRVKEAFRGLEEYSYIWIIWQFSEATHKEWTPTVRPPKLGGNKRMGVFATRSPFRPNNIGISSVELCKIEFDKDNGPVLYVKGADLMDKTPIIDIKPYLPYTDCHTNATGGFALQNTDGCLQVDFEKSFLDIIPKDKQKGLIEILSNDPRPGYQNDENRIYKMEFDNFEIQFFVKKNTLTVCNITKLS